VARAKHARSYYSAYRLTLKIWTDGLIEEVGPRNLEKHAHWILTRRIQDSRRVRAFI